MKQSITITIEMDIDEDDRNANYEYANEIAHEMLKIAKRDDCRANVDVDLD